MNLLENLLNINNNCQSQTNLVGVELVKQPTYSNNLKSLPTRPPPPPPAAKTTFDNDFTSLNETKKSSSPLFFLNDNGYAQFSAKTTSNGQSLNVNMQKNIQDLSNAPSNNNSDPFNMDPFSNVNMQFTKNTDPFGMESFKEAIQPIPQPRLKIGKKLPINQDILLLGDPGIHYKCFKSYFKLNLIS